MNIASQAAQATKSPPPAPVAGTTTSWHQVVLWFLGGVALLALADPAPTLATGLVVVLILGTLLNNWQLYVSYFGGNVSQAASAVKG